MSIKSPGSATNLPAGTTFASPVLTSPVITGTTYANLPPAATVPNAQARVTDVGGSPGSIWTSSGTRWYPLNGRTTLYAKDTRATTQSTTEVVLGQYLIPANVIQVGDRVRVICTYSKSGTVETETVKFRLGTAGTIADATIQSNTALATTQDSMGLLLDFKLMSATSIQKLGNGGTSGYAGSSSGAYPAPVTISSASANALYLSLTAFLSVGSETAALEDMYLELYSTTT